MSKPQNNDQQLVLVFFDRVAIGGGEFKLVPQKPLGEELTPRQAARFLGISRQGVYRLCEIGALTYNRPSPGKILIPLAMLKSHKEKSHDPEFWDIFRNPSQASQASQAS